MGFKSGNITKLKKKVAELNKKAAALNTAYLEALNKEHQNNQAYAVAKQKEAAEKSKFVGGEKRFAEIAEGRGAPPTGIEMAQIRKSLKAGDEAMEIGDKIPVLENERAKAHNAYLIAKQAYNDALAFLSKYLTDKDTFKALGKEDYKAWKAAMTSAITEL